MRPPARVLGTKRPQKPAARQMALRAKVLRKKTCLELVFGVLRQSPRPSQLKSKAKPAGKAGSTQHPQLKLSSGAKEVRQPQTKAATRNKLQGKAASAAEPPKTSEKSKQKKEKAADEPPPVMPYGMVPYTESPAGMQLWLVVC